jgi:hypothetical protein
VRPLWWEFPDAGHDVEDQYLLGPDPGGDEPELGVPGLAGRRVGEPVGPADGGQGRADQDDRRTQAAAVNH